jgi:ComF family protein
MVPLRSEPLPRTESFGFSRLRSIATAALDLLLPPACVLCSGPVDAPGLLCGSCYGQLTAVGEPCCLCCGVPFDLAWHAAEGGLCQRCIDTPPPFERARGALLYDNGSRLLVLPFKHGDRIEFARILARLMAHAGARLLREADVLVPVPLHRRRLFVRRYNQAALLAQALGSMTGLPVLVDALVRVTATQNLDGRSAAERRDEVATAFAVRPRRVSVLSGRRVLLIDDVMTSGATAGACSESLLAAGAAAVDVLVAARVPDPPQQDPVLRRSYRRRKRVPAPSTEADRQILAPRSGHQDPGTKIRAR